MFKKLLVIILSFIMIVSLFTGCSKDQVNGRIETFTWWQAFGEDSIYYSDYAENPAVDYVTNYMTWGTDNKKINIEFLIPPAGSQLDSCITLIGTGDYTDVMDMSFYSNAGSVTELYQDGIALDLTPYVEKYMPNYLKFLNENPDYAKTATNFVDGEKKYLQIYAYHDGLLQWGGYMYRRDWIVKYGTNPVSGEKFTGGYQISGDENTWSDDVVFPSGGSDPVYISDWEWMFEIFMNAMEAEGIDDGYCISLPYQGYIETGDLLGGFGGGGAAWYLNGDTVEFGGNSDSMRAYLQCMNTWYDKGWLDKAFAEHTSDMFFRVDSTKVHQGKVGMVYEAMGLLGSNMDISNGMDNSAENGYTNGICMYPCSQPINDIYGTEDEQYKEPYCMYQVSKEYNSYIVTDKALDKDLEALFSMIDYMYTDAGGLINGFGLNKEQYEITNNKLYNEYNLIDGAYFIVETDEGEKCQYVDLLAKDTNLSNAAKGNRFIGLQSTSREYITVNKIIFHGAYEEWIKYMNTGIFKISFESQRTPEETKTFSKILTNTREFMAKNIPNFIIGTYDPFDDEEWEAYCKALSKYSPETNIEIMQNIYDKLNE